VLDATLAESILHARAPWLARVRGFSAHVVLGRRLLPFCAWHALLLDLTCNPMRAVSSVSRAQQLAALAPDVLDLAALHSAVAICRSVYPQQPSAQLSATGASLLQYRFAKHRARELVRFAQYRVDYVSLPIFGKARDAAEGEPAAKTPRPFLAVVKACASLGIPRREAWMMPLGELLWSS
jgi:hypothetical protein